MKTSKKGLELIKKFEGLRLTAYKPMPHEEKYTIGYGHYGVKEGTKITKEEAEQYLIKDIEKFENQVNKYQSIYNFNQNQFDALVSFAFNVGTIKGLTDYGTRSKNDIGCEILLYHHSGGKNVKGLADRRIAERKLYYTTPLLVD